MINLDEHIELGRQFTELSNNDVEQADIEAKMAWGHIDLPTWPDLLAEHRVVLLSSAGTGKSWEIANQCRSLRSNGNCAFFIRLEDLSDGYDETVFEQGDTSSLQNAILNGDEIWLFLDSIDEARLSDPRKFEKALKHLKPVLKDHLDRTHLILTSRIGAWRPTNDAMRLDALFPFKEKGNTDADGNQSSIKYYTLQPLTSDQMRLYATEKQVEGAEAMIEEIVSAQMADLAGRPKDLDDIISFWGTNRRLGKRLEMVGASVARKLVEHDLDRSERDALTPDLAESGAKKLAASTVLMQQAKIVVPDQGAPTEGFAVNAILPDWSTRNCVSLIARPIFEPETYGFVRFDHRDSKEFLAAKWFLNLIAQGQRRRIEALFFKTQYGVSIVVPSLRPILPWVALFDAPIRARLVRDWPEILLEGGDPASLPLEDRKTLLRHYCSKLAASLGPRLSFDQSALQRLISNDMAPLIRSLANEHAGHEWIERLLLRCIEIGALSDLADLAIGMACKPEQSLYTRQSAMLAARAVASNDELDSTAQKISSDPSLKDRRALAHFIDSFDRQHIPVQTLTELIGAVNQPKRHETDGLIRAIQGYVAECRLEALPDIVDDAARHIKSEPHIEKRYFEVSKNHAWMLNFAVPACERLVDARHVAALSENPLKILSLVSSSRDFEVREVETNLGEKIPAWPELNSALFWHVVGNARRMRRKKDGARLTDWWHAQSYRHQWRFSDGDLDLVIGWIEERDLQDDKLVALSLAFTLYREANRPQSVRRRLWKTVEGNQELRDTLKRLLNPPRKTKEEKRAQKSHTQWERRHKARLAATEANNEDWKKVLPNRLAEIRNEKLAGEGYIWNSQIYLFERMREKREGNSRWSQSNWHDLIEEYGEEIAKAMRVCLTDTWRRYEPGLISDGTNQSNSTPTMEIMGLSGLEIEAAEVRDWPSALSKDDAERASRYLMSELNGFPVWFKAFADRFPAIAHARITAEIDWEMFHCPTDKAPHYVLSDLFYHAPWYNDQVALHLLHLLAKGNPNHLRTLRYALSFVLDSNAIPDREIADLASSRIVAAQQNADYPPLWYAAWVSVEPSKAIPHLTRTLRDLGAENLEKVGGKNERDDARDFAIAFINALNGTRQERGLGVRENHINARHIKDLHLLMHQYIRKAEDTDRSGGGVYSPTSRDDAQDARGKLYDALCDISGKEAFDALVDIAELEANEEEKTWIYSKAYARARADANRPWSTGKINEFETALELTPTTSGELYDIAVNRLLDLKHDYEDGDYSPATVVIRTQLEEELRNYLAGELQRNTQSRYSISQEDEMPNEQRTDIRFMRASVRGMVPVELKIADKWSGNDLFEKLRLQLCGDYLRDPANENGIYLLVNRGEERKKWKLPDGKSVSFEGVVEGLREHAVQLTTTDCEIRDLGVSNLEVIGIDLTKRSTKNQ
jgi:hypothetical protein